ncbi:hypothetical protein L7F22_046964 [Adiantum nelumboides]|nr:hypothetical protein [Adiantum nelumboides]
MPWERMAWEAEDREDGLRSRRLLLPLPPADSSALLALGHLEALPGSADEIWAPGGNVADLGCWLPLQPLSVSKGALKGPPALWAGRRWQRKHRGGTGGNSGIGAGVDDDCCCCGGGGGSLKICTSGACCTAFPPFSWTNSSPATGAPSREPRLTTWKHALTEVTGRIDSSLKHTVLQYMLRSFSEIGSYPQYVDSQTLSPSRFDHGLDVHQRNPSHHLPPLFLGGRIIHRPFISGLAFDSTGVYLAAVTNNGSLAIHDYESLICHAQGSKKDSVTAVMQLFVCPHLEAVAWNPQNQDEVACVAGYVGKLLCYDISRFSNDPSQVLKVSARAEKVESTGLSDLSFCKLGGKRILASGKKHGEMYLWDTRTNTVPQSVFSSLQHNQLNTLALTRDEQVNLIRPS